VGFNPGERIGNYRVESELGASGAGLLVHAQHLVLPRHAIIKVVHPAFAASQPYVLQTLREACILEALAHPGVPMIYESGVLRDRRPWFALEVIGGPTLEDALAPGPLSLVEVAGLLCGLSEILEHAHRRGVIHRGLRPDRIVITSERRYPLCIPDWSEAIAHDATSHLRPATPVGAHAYIAPELAYELARDRAPDPEAVDDALSHAPARISMVDDRADLFALGVIAYRALTGALPFTPDGGAPDGGAPDGGALDRGSYVRALARRPDAPGELAALIDALLSFDRFDRPNACEVRAEIDGLFDAAPALAIGSVRRDAPPVQQHAAAQFTTPRGKVANDVAINGDTIRTSSSRLRRPRWTPNVRYLETTHVDIKLAAVEDDRIKD